MAMGSSILLISFFFLFSHSAVENEPIQLFYMAPFLSRGGYSSEALTFAVGMYENTVEEELKLQIVHSADDPNFELMYSFPPSLQEKLKELFKMKHFYPVEKPPGSGKIIIICHSEPGSWHPALYHTLECPLMSSRFSFQLPEDRIYKIGRTMFETDRFPDGWDVRLNNMDEIWVPTKFHVETFSKYGVDRDKLVVVPESVDLDFYSPEGEKLIENEDDRTIFLSVFKLEERKGWKILIEAFYETFILDSSFSSQVELVVLTNKYHQEEGVTIEEILLKHLQDKYTDTFESNSKKVEEMIRILSDLSHMDMPRLYRSATVFVLPTRGEGWGRPYTESMSCGIPCIATDWSGPTEYMNEENSYLLRINGLVKVPKDFAFQGHYWADPSIDHLKELMLHVHINHEEVKMKGLAARKTMEDDYSMKKLTDIIMGNLRRINGMKQENSDIESSDEL